MGDLLYAGIGQWPLTGAVGTGAGQNPGGTTVANAASGWRDHVLSGSAEAKPRAPVAAEDLSRGLLAFPA